MSDMTRAMRHNVRYEDTQNIKGTLEEELYDVLYYVLALANLYEVDLETIMHLKEPISSAKYGQLDVFRRLLGERKEELE